MCNPEGYACFVYQHTACVIQRDMHVLFTSILQSSAAYVPLEADTPGLLSARVMSRCGLKYCAVKTDLLQV